jgi:hypothetical protein
MKGETGYQWLKRMFPKGHPLGGVIGQFDYLGWRTHKHLPFKMDEHPFDDPNPPQSELIIKEWKSNEEVRIIRFDTTGVYVMAWATEEVCIPFSAFRSFRKV